MIDRLMDNERERERERENEKGMKKKVVDGLMSNIRGTHRVC